jgi:1-acyl-sn-glycerol-3-phosphate acyltransferase
VDDSIATDGVVSSDGLVLWEVSERLRLRGALTRLYRVDVHGAERVPEGACILIANHESVLDPWFLSLATRRRVRFMAKAELWRYAPVRWAMEAYGTFPVERGSGDTGAMAHAGELLAAGEILGMFPSGTSKPGGNLRWHRGAARLALAYGAPLVPVRLIATRQLVPRRPVEVRVGDPITVGRRRPTIAESRELTRRAEAAVESL